MKNKCCNARKSIYQIILINKGLETIQLSNRLASTHFCQILDIPTTK